jgi:Carboxypeptidase regulatory-like domain/TonB dependent receptor
MNRGAASSGLSTIVFSLIPVLLASLVLLTGVLVFGQAETGDITGVAKDTTGAVVAGAQVIVRNSATNAERTAVTGDFGQYSVQALPPGNYGISVSKAGFKRYETTVEVTVGGHSKVDVPLAIGTGSTVVEVTAAGAGTEINTQTQELQQLVDTQQLAQLPSLTRNPYDFVMLAGNVSAGDSTTPNFGGSQNQTGRGTGFSINGQRESGTEILLDGVENINLFTAQTGTQIPVDSVQEYSVITNNFGPEYGRASGGIVNLTTKAGTNNWHGTAWEFNRLSAYTANTFDNVAKGIPKGDYTRNMFGAQAGGPIMKDKLFVFLTSEWLRVRSQPYQTEEVLDPGFISLLPGNVQSFFSAYGAAPQGLVPGPCSNGLECTTAGQLAAAGTTVPNINGVSAISPSQPVFDVATFKVNADAGGDVPQNTYRLTGRLDYDLGQKTQMFFRYARDIENQFLGSASAAPTAGVGSYTPYSQYDVGTGIADQAWLYSISHAFNSRLIDNTKVSLSRINVIATYNNALNFTPNLILTNGATDPTNESLIQMPGLLNFANGAGGLPAGGPLNTVQFEHDLSWTKGRHNMRFGGQFTYIQVNYTYGAYNQAVELLGNFLGQGIDNLVNAGGDTDTTGTFASPAVQFTNRVNPQGALPCVANPDQSLQLTPACTVTPPLRPPNSSRSYRYKDWAVYAQDTFRFTPRLTLNYGLRYEHYGTQHNVNPSLDSNFYFGPGAGIEQQVRSGQVQIADKSAIGQFWAPSWGTAAPRVGFAYDLFGNGKTSLRGGFGISYERNFGNVTYNASFNPPASAAINAICINFSNCPYLVSNNDLGPLGLAGAAPQGLPPVDLRMPDPNIRTAQTQFWSFDVQHELARNTILDIGYSGAHGVHLYDVQNINQEGGGQFYLGDPLSFPGFADCPSPCLTRPNQQYANINMRGSLGLSSYDGLNVRLQTQNIRNSGLSLVANYTWSHSLDDISSTFSDSLQGGSEDIGSFGYTDLLNPKLDWGSSDYDVKQRVVISPIWATPWLKGKRGWGGVLGGWTVSGIFTARTGTPFSIFDYTDDDFDYTVPRETPSTPFTSHQVSGPSNLLSPNVYGILTVPVPAEVAPLDPALGISDLGPFPVNMMRRNSLRGPGAWNLDAALQKDFKLTERLGLEFRAEGFNVFNHHNLYVYTGDLDFGTEGPGAAWSAGTSASGVDYVTGFKGGLHSLAVNGNHDERRFGQFALRLTF